ncbi:hypothetical protein B0H16DRAFT_1759170 [Mycena metata]|uniref:Uncharacterized protein n=1 Tax=Mycena metata TaxID=1033252 RepID=A0AAD7ID49_9AGAR|nr:hypothetical protein B0H16DRAFT_1759170 [Mycena metata]
MGVSMPPIADITLLLTLLKWVGYDVEAISMLNPLTLPLLTSLDIDSGLNDPADEEGFFSLCKRSSFTLQYLRLAGIPLSLPRLSTYLLAMPSLTVLKLSSCIDNDSTDGFLTFLTYDERQPVLPQLKELSIYRPQARFSAWVMLQMVESRWPSTPLTEVWIGSTAKDSQVPPPVLDRIIGLVEEGLQFRCNFSWASGSDKIFSQSDESLSFESDDASDYDSDSWANSG